MGTIHKDRQDDPAALCEVWKNCFIIRALRTRSATESQEDWTRRGWRLQRFPPIRRQACNLQVHGHFISRTHSRATWRRSGDLLVTPTMQAIHSAQTANRRSHPPYPTQEGTPLCHTISAINRRHELQRTAAGHRGCNRRASWPPSLSFGVVRILDRNAPSPRQLDCNASQRRWVRPGRGFGSSECPMRRRVAFGRDFQWA